MEILNTKTVKKFLAVILTVSLLFFYTLSPALTTLTSTTYAQTVTDTPTPTPDSSVVTATPTPDPSATTTPTPTPDPSAVTPTPTPDPSSTTTNASNSADLSNTVGSTSITGDNTASASATTNSDSSGSSSGGGSGGSSTQTGDAASLVTGQNSVNSTAVNSNVVDQTINIYVTQNGNLNLSDPFAVAASEIQAHPNDPIINVSFTNINNYAYLTNTVNSLADTGNNTANGSATINTGNAYSVVNLLNQVNFTVLNSQIHIITINIFGTLNGNIILPDINASTNCSGCGVNIMASNSGTLTNNLNSTANTGNNTATGSATITTGDANSVSNVLNLLNTNLYGTNAQVLFINVLGNWIGNFIGWGNLGPQQGGANLTFFNLGPAGAGGGTNGCSSCTGSLNLNNFASVVNNINSSANTGGNSLNGNGSITTGNAYSAISLINFINSNFINSFGFFGFINIFGNWTGNIGGLSNFLALDNSGGNQTQDTPQTTNNNSSTSTAQEQGGQLSVTQTNNVGSFVYPGDTVTFFVKVKNSGTGKVYGTKLNLFLIYAGQIAGGTSFDLSDIPSGSKKELTTGFVLSKNAPRGLYIARAYVTGHVGPDNHTVTATSDSNFNIFSYATLGSNNKKTTVLGVANRIPNNTANASSEDAFYLTLIILLTFAYVSIRLIRKREYIFEVISSPTFKEKLVSIKMLML